MRTRIAIAFFLLLVNPAIGQHSVDLSWTEAGTALSFNIYRSLSPGICSLSSPPVITPYATALSTSYTDFGVTAGTGYYYVVTAVTSGGETQCSDEAFAFVPSNTQAAAQRVTHSRVGGGRTIGPFPSSPLVVCGPPNYPCGLANVSATVSPAHVDVGPNVCNWSSAATLATCGNLTGANTAVTPNSFGPQVITRITDKNTACGGIAASAANVWITADDGIPNLWNTDDTAFLIKKSGQQRCLMHWNGTAATPSPLVLGSYQSTFSKQNNNQIFQLQGVTIVRLDVDLGADTATSTTIYNAANSSCLGVGYTATWTGLFIVSNGDTSFNFAVSNSGGQGTGELIVNYSTNTGVCSIWDTNTRQVKNNGVLAGIVSNTDRFLVHDSYQTQNPSYAQIVAQSGTYTDGTYTPGYYLWQPGTTTVNFCTLAAGQFCDGHFAPGYAGSIRGKKATYVTFPASTQTNNLSFSLSAGADIHPSWNNNFSLTDASWILFKGQNAGETNPQGPFAFPFWDEIYMIKNAATNTVSRQCHTYSGQHQTFEVANAIASVSQTGKYALFPSNWVNELGSTAGAATCIAGSSCRADDFVCKLQ